MASYLQVTQRILCFSTVVYLGTAALGHGSDGETQCCYPVVLAAKEDGRQEACEVLHEMLWPLDGERKGHFTYREEAPGSPISAAVFEFWQGGQLLWDAGAERRCSQGVSRCWLSVPFSMNSASFGAISSEMNEVTLPSGQKTVVFSHLSAKITSLYLRDRPLDDIRLLGMSYDGNDYPRRADMVLPSNFLRFDCP